MPPPRTHSGGRPVGRSDPETYRPPSELGPGEAYPRLKLVLREAPPAIDLILLDDDSGEELDAHAGVPNVMRRAEEDDLL